MNIQGWKPIILRKILRKYTKWPTIKGKKVIKNWKIEKNKKLRPNTKNRPNKLIKQNGIKNKPDITRDKLKDKIIKDI